MVGANYMGGKRNTARAKSKDAVGRMQRRHFGKQRLVSALCMTQKNRVRPSSPTLSSVLPEITLAHARCDARTDSGTVPSMMVSGGDRLYSSTLLNDTAQRSKPSKILGALDISDHASMRAAIGRILQRPNLVGINAPNHRDSAYAEYLQAPATVRRQIDAHLDSKDLDTHSEIVSEHVSGPQSSCSSIPRHRLPDILESSLTTRHCTAERSILPSSDSPLGMCSAASQDTLDDIGYANVQLPTRVNSSLCIEGDGSNCPDTFLGMVHPLPPSSPFSSSPQPSDDLILDLDTSPPSAVCLERSDDLSEEHTDCAGASSLRSVHRPMACQSSWNLPIQDGSTGAGDEARFTNTRFTGWNEEVFKAERSQTITSNDYRILPSVENNCLLSSFKPGYIRVLTNQEVTKDDGPSDLSIDFLSDPYPWETINRILQLEPPEPSAMQSVKIDFTKEREGVGYNSTGGSGPCNARSSGAASFETETDDKPTDDIHALSSTDFRIFDWEMTTGDNRRTLDTPDSRCSDNSIRALFDAGSAFTTPTDSDSCIHVRAAQDATSISVNRCAQKHTRSSTPLAIAVGTNVAEMTFDGPCLFGDSDLEEDE